MLAVHLTVNAINFLSVTKLTRWSALVLRMACYKGSEMFKRRLANYSVANIAS